MADVERFWDRLARGWEKPADLEQPDSQVVVRARALLGSGDRVLDYGCASGSVAIRLAGSVAAIDGLDISSKMIAVARRSAEVLETGNVSFIHGTIFDAALPVGSYDAVLAFSIFHLLQDAEGVLTRIRELLKPGGRLISVTPCLSEKKALPTRLLVLAARAGCWLRLIPPVRFLGVSELQEAIARAGFQLTEVDDLGQDIPEYFIAAEKR